MNQPRSNNRIDYLEFNAATPESLAETRKFYGDAFGWEYKGWGPEYADTQSSGLGSGIAVGKQPPLPVIYCSDLEAAKSRVIKSGATLIRDIFEFPGGRRFHFKDPAGNELAVWSER